MYASASTWLFNVVRQMAAAKREVRTHFLLSSADFSEMTGPGALHLVKSHEITDTAVVGWLSAHADKIVISIRDPRDAVSSLMLYHGYVFDRALNHAGAAARLCLRFAQDQRSLLLPYETGFFDEAGTLKTLDVHLGFNTAPAVMDDIFRRSRRTEIERYIAGLPSMPGVLQNRESGDMLDPNTHWHTHHAGRSGEIGRWKRQLTTEQVAKVQASLADCFRFDA